MALVDNQKIEVVVNNRNKQHYKEKGFVVKHGETIYVSPEQLPKSSHKKVLVTCDNPYCENFNVPHEVQWVNYLKTHDDDLGDFCSACGSYKARITCKEKYGVEYPMQTDAIKNRTKNTCLHKYGISCVLHTENNRQKTFDALISKYGSTSPFVSNDVREKSKQTMIDRYGVENAGYSDELNLKRENTMLQKYGVKYAMSSPELKQKARDSMFNNNTTPTSQQQIEIFNMLKQKYKNCYLNYQCSSLMLDIMLDVDGCKIDIEYDGWYWHKDNKISDFKRDKIVQKYGYKVIRILSKHRIPTMEQLEHAINDIITNNKHFTQIILPDWKGYTS